MGKRHRIDGQAVIDGVLVQTKNNYALAIKKYNGNIVLDKNSTKSVKEKVGILKLPVLRGIVSFIESFILGADSLKISAEYAEMKSNNLADSMVVSKEEEKQKAADTKSQNQLNMINFMMLILLIACGIGAILIVPTFIAGLFFNNFDFGQRMWFNAVAGLARIVLFIVFLFLLSLSDTLKNIYKYFSATNKAINCYENDQELTIDNVRSQSKYHPRNIVTLLFVIILVSSIVFAFFKPDNLLLMLVERIVLLPLIIGVSYEITAFLGMLTGSFGRALSMPVTWFQCFITKEPDDFELYVAIAAVNAVLDGDEYENY